MRGNGSGFRASSQPPAHPGSAIFVTGPPINNQPRYYRNPSGWTGPMVTGSAGSLDKVSYTPKVRILKYLYRYRILCSISVSSAISF